MFPVWRLARNRYTRRLYDRLDAAGVTAARMIEYEADLPGRPDDGDEAGRSGRREDGGPQGVVYAAGPADDERFRGLDLAFSIPASPLDGEWAVVAVADGEAVGRTMVSVGQRPSVEPLGRRMSFDGAYVRRVYVHPDWRGNGIAKRLVGDALTVAADEFGADAATALIAADNRPSRWVFEARGFRPVRRHDHVRLFGREYRRTTPLEASVRERPAP